MDMTERVNELIFICERMIEILNKENEALEAQTPHVLMETMVEKDKMSRLYERHTRAVSQNAAELKKVDEDLQTHLKEVSREMDKLVEINARMLKLHMDLNRRVLERFADVAQKLTPHSGTYNAAANVGVKAEATAPISLNESL
ncbi:flagellar export chaperone FlgN [Terasakiella sp. SH-1]|uniref:flagellar export chaperone FlgN n=1 Tax=Terasakiella sp. SH-1 TaxID=2560057 RepID=UPI00107422BC|nr:flagellar export chaperone FlgN [Terasakiella sp. SH-1]